MDKLVLLMNAAVPAVEPLALNTVVAGGAIRWPAASPRTLKV